MTPFLRALGQLDDAALLGALLRSMAWAALGFVVVALALGWGGMAGAAWLAGAYPRLMGWLEWFGGFAGLVGAAVLAMLLFVPVATAIATLFVDRIAEAVERRHFPGLPPGQPASLGSQAWDGVALGLLVLAMQVLALLMALLLPGVGLLLGWLVTSWAIGRGLFMAVAMRRCDRALAGQLYRRHRGAVLLQGGLVALAGVVPLLNLAAPVLGMAAMVHVLGRVSPPLGLSAPPAV